MDGLTDGRTDGRTDGWADGRTDGRMDGLTDGQMNGLTDGRTDARTDRRTHGRARTHLIAHTIKLALPQVRRLEKEVTRLEARADGLEGEVGTRRLVPPACVHTPLECVPPFFFFCGCSVHMALARDEQ